MLLELQVWTGLSPGMLFYAFLAILIAAVIRGYSGFGFSALTVTSLSLILPPAEVVPTAFLLEIAASVFMLPMVWRSIDWQKLNWLVLGIFAGTPAGLLFLAEVPQDPVRFTISGLVLVACFLLWKNVRIRSEGGRKRLLVVGGFSGLVNGAAGIGGLPIVLFLLSGSIRAEVLRATIVAFLFCSDIYATLLSGSQNLLSNELLTRSVLFLFPLVVGVAVGHRGFVKSSPESFRKFSIGLLILLSLAVIVRGLLV